MSFFLGNTQPCSRVLYSINCDWRVWSPHSCIEKTTYPINSEGLRTGLWRPFHLTWPLWSFVFSHFCWQAGASSSLCHVMFERLCLYTQWVICLLNAWKLIPHLYENQLCVYYLHRMHVHFLNMLWEPVLTLEEVQTWVVRSLCPLEKNSSYWTSAKYSNITVPHFLLPYIWELRFSPSLLGLEESVTYPIAIQSRSPSVWQGYWLRDFLSTE